MGRFRFASLPLAMIALGGLLLAGCVDSAKTQPGSAATNTLSSDIAYRQDLFEHAVDNLHRLEQFQPQAMLDQIRQQLNDSVDWNRDVDWEIDPLIASLPESVREIELLKSLEDVKLNAYDSNHLQEAVTLQGIARMASQGATGDLDRAAQLFDWVVRNVQFPTQNDVMTVAGQSVRVPHFPMETLFFGRGDSLDRAWAFVLLCRQLELDAVILALPGATETDPPRPWAVGVMVDDEMYLFDPTLGLPLPGKDGNGIATLSQIAADDSVLRQLDLDAEHRYPVTAETAQGLIALVEASPAYLARRMQVLEGKLAGEDKVVLTVEPSRVAERAKKFPQVAEARLWGVPYERLMLRFAPQSRDVAVAALQEEMTPYRIDLLPEEYQPIAANLQRGRVLHLKGIFAAEEGEPSANLFYQNSRLADDDINAAQLSDIQKRILHRAKDDASYWLGLVAYERGKYDTAIDHLQKRTLSDARAGAETNRWINGARYNIGRADEALGKKEPAIAAYEASQDAQIHGNLIRARRLGAKIELTKPETSPESTEDEKPMDAAAPSNATPSEPAETPE